MTLTIHTLDEAAAILRVKPSWLERQAAARKIPFTMLGGSYRFTADHLAAIVILHENRPAPRSLASSEPRPRGPGRSARSNELEASELRPRPVARPRSAA
jgi:excisionase family DNA binding protein